MIKKEKFSYSKISTFSTCRWKYYLNYVLGFKVARDDNVELANKGIVFHDIAENYTNDKTADALEKEMLDKASQLKVDVSKYNYKDAAIYLKWFMSSWVKPLEDKGFSIFRETWSNGEINDVPFGGILDFKMMSDKEDTIYIVDFKSAASTSTDRYKKQLLVYAYLVGLEKNWSYDDIVKNISLYVFFPLAEAKKRLKSSDEKAADLLKQIIYTKIDLATAVGYVEQSIKDVLDFNWDEVNHARDANVQFTCMFCSYAGIPSDYNKDCYCNKSITDSAKKYSAPRSILITSRSKP